MLGFAALILMAPPLMAALRRRRLAVPH